MKLVTARIGNKYGSEYETYLEKKLPDYEFIWAREPIQDNVQLQWNKMYGMNLDIDEPICVMDIDVLLINDYKFIIELVFFTSMFQIPLLLPILLTVICQYFH